MSTTLINNLANFNRKERFHLLSDAFGLAREPGAGDQGPSELVALSAEFAKKVRATLGRDLGGDIPKGAFWAMDYHLDWIYASLLLASKGIDLQNSTAGLLQENGRPSIWPREGENKISGTQQDVDFLIAFPAHDDPVRTHLIMIEAKFDTAWGNEQLLDKANRLKAIFDSSKSEWDSLVKPSFVIASPKEPKSLKYDALPDWAKVDGKARWFELSAASGKGAGWSRVVRCYNDHAGTESKSGKFWRVERDAS